MGRRLELQTILEELLGSKNVYYQPPESVKLQYPAIIYNKSRMKSFYANNRVYRIQNEYSVTVVSKKPDSEVIDKIAHLPTASFDRHYISDNLNHDVFTLDF